MSALLLCSVGFFAGITGFGFFNSAPSVMQQILGVLCMGFGVISIGLGCIVGEVSSLRAVVRREPIVPREPTRFGKWWGAL